MLLLELPSWGSAVITMVSLSRQLEWELSERTQHHLAFFPRDEHVGLMPSEVVLKWYVIL